MLIWISTLWCFWTCCTVLFSKAKVKLVCCSRSAWKLCSLVRKTVSTNYMCAFSTHAVCDSSNRMMMLSSHIIWLDSFIFLTVNDHSFPWLTCRPIRPLSAGLLSWEGVFVSTCCSDRWTLQTADKSPFSAQRKRPSKVIITEEGKKTEKVHYPKNHFITVKTQKSHQYFQRQDGRDVVKQGTRRTACHGSHFLKSQFHRMTTQIKIHFTL